MCNNVAAVNRTPTILMRASMFFGIEVLTFL